MFQLITTSQVGLKVVPVVRCELNDGLQIRVPTGSMKSATRLKIKLKQSITLHDGEVPTCRFLFIGKFAGSDVCETIIY